MRSGRDFEGEGRASGGSQPCSSLRGLGTGAHGAGVEQTTELGTRVALEPVLNAPADGWPPSAALTPSSLLRYGPIKGN